MNVIDMLSSAQIDASEANVANGFGVETQATVKSCPVGFICVSARLAISPIIGVPLT